MRSPLHVLCPLLCLVCVHVEGLVFTPSHQMAPVPPVGRFIPTSDASYHCGVTCRLLNDDIFVGGDAVTSEDGAEDGRKTPELDSP